MLSIMINNQPYVCHLSNVMIQSKWKISFKKLNIQNSTNLSLNPKLSKVAYSSQDGSVYLCPLYNQSFNLNFNSNESKNLDNENQVQIFEPGSEVVHLFWFNDFSQLCAIKRGGELFLYNFEDNSSFSTTIRDLSDVDSLEFDNLTKTLLCINGKCLINIAFCTLNPPLCLTSTSLFTISTGKMIASIHIKSNSQFNEILSLPPEIFPISKAVESEKSDLAVYGGNRLVVITENKLFLTKISEVTAFCWCNEKLYVFCTATKIKSKLSSSNLTIFTNELVKIGSISSPHLASTVSASPKNNRIVISSRHFLTVFDFDASKSIQKPPSSKFQESHIGWEDFSLTVTTFTIPEPIINAICGFDGELWLHLQTKTSAGSSTDSYNFGYIRSIDNGKIEKERKRNGKEQDEYTEASIGLTENETGPDGNTKGSIGLTENETGPDGNTKASIGLIENETDQDGNTKASIGLTENKTDQDGNTKASIGLTESGKDQEGDTKGSSDLTEKSSFDFVSDAACPGGDDSYYDNIVVSFPSFNVIETNADKLWRQPKLDLVFIEKSNTVKIYSFLSQLFSYEVSYCSSSTSSVSTGFQIDRKSDKPLCSMETDFVFLSRELFFGTFPFTLFDFAFRVVKEEISKSTQRCFSFLKSIKNSIDFNRLLSQICVFSLQEGKIVDFVRLMKLFDKEEALSALSTFDKNILEVLATTLSIDNDEIIEISELFGSFDTDSQIQILTTSSPSEFLKIICNEKYKKMLFKIENIKYLSKIVDSLIMSMEWSKLERFCDTLLNNNIDIDLPSKLMSFKELGALQFGQTLKIIEKDNFKWNDVGTFSMDSLNQKDLLKNLGFAFTAADFGQWAAACFSVTGDASKCRFVFLDKPDIINDVNKFINDKDNADQVQMISFLRDIISEIKGNDV